MIQFKSKHPYSNKSDRWYPMLTPKPYKNLEFEDYSYIFGDKIFTKASDEAKQAYDAAMLWWERLQSDS